MSFKILTKLAVAGLSAVGAIAFLRSPPAEASAECGLSQGKFVQGTKWVSECRAGVDVFRDTWATVEFRVLQNNPFGLAPGDFQVVFKGPATITRAEGRLDPDGGIIETQIGEELKGLLGGSSIQLTGNGTGAITDKGIDPLGRTMYPNGNGPVTPNDGYADSVFNVITGIELNTGDSDPVSLSTLVPVRVVGDRRLTGVSPDVIIPPTGIVPNQGVPDPDLKCIPMPPVAINYCGSQNAAPIPLFINDDPNLPAGVLILSETHTVHPPIPEPSSVLASIAVLGSMFGLKRKAKKES